MKKFPALFAVALIAAALMVALAGCGGSGSDLPTPPDTTPFHPTVHAGYAVYLIGGQWDQSYIPQTKSDGFTVTAGVYKPVCLITAEVSETIMNTQGGVPWTATFTCNGQTLSPTERGWVFSPGNTYNGTIPNPGGGNIQFTVDVTAATLDGMTVAMVPTDLTGNDYPQATDGHYQIPCYQTYIWVAKWTKNGQIVTQTRYDAYANKITSGDLQYADGGYYSNVISISNFGVYAYEQAASEMGGGEPIAIGIVTIDFTASQEVGHQPSVG